MCMYHQAPTNQDKGGGSVVSQSIRIVRTSFKRSNLVALASNRIQPLRLSCSPVHALRSALGSVPLFPVKTNKSFFHQTAQLPRPGDVLWCRLFYFDPALHERKVQARVCVCFVCETDTRSSEHELASLLQREPSAPGPVQDDTSKARCDVEPSAATSV